MPMLSDQCLNFLTNDDMIVTEYYTTRSDGARLIRTYSDKNLYIRKVGTDEVYSEAIDIEGKDYVYEETDDVIDIPELAINLNEK